MGWLEDLMARFRPQQKASTGMATFVARISGGDRSTFSKGNVAGTDLLIPYQLENGSVGFLGGDSFSEPFPGAPPPSWRSPVAFRSNVNPATNVIEFDSAYGAPAAGGFAPEIVPNQHSGNPHNAWNQEFTVIPNDCVAHPSTKRHVMSFMSINRWKLPDGSNGGGWTGDWRTNYNALAYSDNGNTFTRLPGSGGNAVWWNNEQNTSPFQMMTFADSMQGWIYVYSVRAGRQSTPFMLQRVMWDQMFNKAAYQGWRLKNGTWGWGAPDECTSLFPEKKIGEPSVRRLANGTWAMAYWTTSTNWTTGGLVIVTRTSPDGIVWSAEKVQVTLAQQPALYGGFIHPYSSTGTNQLTLLVSHWDNNNYHVNQYRGTL